MRLVGTSLVYNAVKDQVPDVVSRLYHHVPAGVGSSGAIKRLSSGDLRQILSKGSRWAIEHGFGKQEDVDFTEEGGCLAGADPDQVSERAKERGSPQLGTLGSGNHFLEMDVVDEILLPEVAETFGLRQGNLCVFIHSGSRGLG
ncbi:MAG: RNA-splicing ligase RtcB, partial [Acidobacteria bacterium]